MAEDGQRSPGRALACAASSYQILGVRRFLGHTISGRGFNPFKPLRRHSGRPRLAARLSRAPTSATQRPQFNRSPEGFSHLAPPRTPGVRLRSASGEGRRAERLQRKRATRRSPFGRQLKNKYRTSRAWQENVVFPVGSSWPGLRRPATRFRAPVMAAFLRPRGKGPYFQPIATTSDSETQFLQHERVDGRTSRAMTAEAGGGRLGLASALTILAV